MSEEQHLGDEDPVEMKVQSVPDSWELIDFESAFELVSANDRKVPSSAYLREGPLPVVDQGQQFIGGFTDKVDLAIEPGDGLLVFGDHTRIFKPIDFPFAPGADGIKILRPRVASMKYSFYACSSLQFPNKGYARHYSHLHKCKLPVAPQQEQTRIVSKIDELFSQIEHGERALDRVRKLVERYRQSVLKAAVTGELTREWREQQAGESESGESLLTRILEARRKAWETAELAKMTAKKQRPTNDLWKKKYKEPAAPDSVSLAELPSGWIWVTLDQLSTKVVDGTHFKPNYVDSGIPFISVKDIRNGVVNFHNCKFIAKDDHDELSKRCDPETGDLLVTKSGTIGRTAVIQTDEAFSLFVSVALVKPLALIAGEWLKLGFDGWFQTVNVQNDITGTALKNLHLVDLRVVCIPLPPTRERRLIMDEVSLVLSRISNLESDLSGQMNKAQAMRQAVLKAAFCGQLVPQDPRDEPASALLERISAGRSKAAAHAPGKNTRTKKPKGKAKA